MYTVRAFSRAALFCCRYLHSHVCFRVAACAFLATAFSSPHLAGATVVRMETAIGVIDIELYDEQAPKTVANFLLYAGRGDYTKNGFIHRSIPGFVLQGGGFSYIDLTAALGFPHIEYFHITEDPPIQNEFSPSRSNVRGTIAMGKYPGYPDSATSEWFFNLADNGGSSPNGLDFQNGGFTVFGHVLAGMNVVDDIARLKVWNASSLNSAFTNLPLINDVSLRPIQPSSDLVMVNRIPNVKSARTQQGAWVTFTADADMALNSVGTVDTATTQSRLATFTPPSNNTVLFSVDMFTFTMAGVVGQAGRIVTLHDGVATRPPNSHYYAYGPTPDNRTPHWYDFVFDGETGAEISDGKIMLHFVDGERGDDDLTVNNSIQHTGVSAVVMGRTSTQSGQPAGCSMTASPSQSSRGGDWIVVSLFLFVVAVIRKRNINDRFCGTSNS